MTRIILTVSFCLSTLWCTAQTRSAAPMPIDSLTKSVQRFINDQQADSLYNIMGDGLKGRLNAEQIQEFTGDLVGQLGRWVSFKQTGTMNGLTRYEAVFPLGTLNFFISQDASGKIAQFSFMPPEDEQ